MPTDPAPEKVAALDWLTEAEHVVGPDSVTPVCAHDPYAERECEWRAGRVLAALNAAGYDVARIEEGERLDFADELLDADHEIAAFLHPFIWNHTTHVTEPGDGSDCHECYGESGRLREVIESAQARAALAHDVARIEEVRMVALRNIAELAEVTVNAFFSHTVSDREAQKRAHELDAAIRAWRESAALAASDEAVRP